MSHQLLTPTEAYLSFLNKLNLPFQAIAILKQEPHPDSLMSGWKGLVSLTCLDAAEQQHEIDIRYAWGREIWQQHLFDYGWDEDKLLSKQRSLRSKLIIYLCEPETGISAASKLISVPSKYLVGRYWTEITHAYIPLPLYHPFGELAKSKTNYSGYATTRRLEKQLNDNCTSSHPQLTGGLRSKGWYKESSADKPLISVITVVYNGEEYLEQTIQSVINQTYENLEYMIIDGGSTDNTLSIIQQYEEQIDYWVSEPDGGIYDAMNKGTKVALGSHTLHINADDLLCYPDSLELDFQPANTVGNAFVFQPEENFVKKRLSRQSYQHRAIDIIRCPIYHPCFIGLRNHRSYFDTSYKIIADNMAIAAKIATEPVTYVPQTIAIHRGGGVSADNNQAIDREIIRATVKTTNLRVLFHLAHKLLYSYAREIAKRAGLVKLRRKYL